MFSCLSRNFDTVNECNSMIELGAVVLIAALNRPPAMRDMAMRCLHPLHLVRPEGQQIESSIVGMLTASIRHRHARAKMRTDLARVDRVLHQCGSDVYGRDAVRVMERRLADVLQVDGEGLISRERDPVARWRRCLVCWGRYKASGAVDALVVVLTAKCCGGGEAGHGKYGMRVGQTEIGK
jgi:hypothetical protein